jgi:hypothetical protein
MYKVDNMKCMTEYLYLGWTHMRYAYTRNCMSACTLNHVHCTNVNGK